MTKQNKTKEWEKIISDIWMSDDEEEMSTKIKFLLTQERQKGKKRFLDIIGEDETPLVKSSYPRLGELSFDTTQFDEAIIRNKFRSELKSKLEIKEEK